MRIAIVTEGYLPELSGVTISLDYRLKVLSQWGHVVRVYAPDYAMLAKLYPNYADFLGEIYPGVTIMPFPSRKFYVDYTLDPQTFKLAQVEKDIETFAPDVIHIECPERLFMGFLGWPGISLARRNKLPVTAMYHTNYLDYVEDFKNQVGWIGLPGVVGLLRKVFVAGYNRYDATLVPTPAIERYLRGWGIRNLRQDWFNGVDTQAFSPVPGQPSRPLTLLYVGRLTPDKQLDYLLQAFDCVAAETPNLRFILVGSGTEDAHVAEWARAYPGTILTGRVAHAETARYYQMSDVFVTASTKENRPLSVQEAMSSGLAVVAPAAGGIPDMIEHEKTGLLARPYDAASLANEILRLARNPELRAKLGLAARQNAESLYSWETATQAMLDLWQSLLAKKQPPGA